MKRILTLPLDAARTAWSFVNPSRTAGRIPLGRVAIAAQIAALVIFVGYTLSKKSIDLPFSAEPYRVEVVFPNAQGLDRLDQPAAAIAGTPLGSVEKVRYDQGQARVMLRFDAEVKGKVFADARASIRPASALQNLLVNVDPGTPSTGAMPNDGVIGPARTKGYVTLDELTGILDADTQAYVTILVQQARLSLRGREGELRRALGEVGKLAATATPVSRALADRRRLLTALVGELEVVFRTLGQRGDQLAQAIESGSRTLEVTAGREDELAELTRELGPTLVEARRALAGIRALAEPLLPALNDLAPGAAALPGSFRKLRGQLPQAERLLGRFEALVRDGRRPLGLLHRGSRGLRGRAEALVPVMRDATRLARDLDKYKGGVAQTADTLSGNFSRQDNVGPYGPIDIVKTEGARPENFGMAASAARRRGGAPSRLDRDFARALEGVCVTQNPLACLMRFNTPGLPKQPLLRNVSDFKGGKR